MLAKIKLLKGHQGFMRYYRNTSWLLMEKVLRMIVGLSVGVWVARYLGPEQFGLFSYVTGFVGLFAVVATLGLDTVVVRELVKGEAMRDELLGTAFGLKLIGAFTMLLALGLATKFTSNDTYTNFLVFIVASAAIFQSFNVIDLYFQSEVMSKYVAYSNTLGLLSSSVARVILVINEAPLIAFVWVVFFESIVLACGFIYFYIYNVIPVQESGRLRFFSWRFSRLTAIDLLKDSWPLILSGIVISIYLRIDMVMIKEMLGTDAVGQYAAAVKLSETWYFIPMVITSSVFPAIVSSKAQGEELYYARLQKLYYLMVWLAVTIALPMTFLSDWIVGLLYGSQYGSAGSVLMIHIWAGVFVFLGVASGKWFVTENYTRKNFYRTFLGLVVNLFLNYMMIPVYGIVGAAIATLLGQFAANVLYDVFDKQTYKSLKLKYRALFPIHLLIMRAR